MSISVATVAIGEGLKKISASAVRRELMSAWPSVPEPTRASKMENALAFRVGASHVVLGVEPSPIPWSDLEGPCLSSWLWPEAAGDLRRHRSHVVVQVEDDNPPVQRAELLTMATASLLQTCDDALGVYWPAGDLVVSPALFREFAVGMLPGRWPLYAWVDFRVVDNGDGGSSGFTTGMSGLGHMELETAWAAESPSDLRERFFGIAQYLLENGACIRDGDTIGVDRFERIRVIYSKSIFGHPENVMRLDYGRPPRKPLARTQLWRKRKPSRVKTDTRSNRFAAALRQIAGVCRRRA